MSILNVPFGCGDGLCEARIVALLFGPDDRGRADPCPACLAAVELSMGHWRDDRARTLRAAGHVIVGLL